jgi:hypothetical protein
VGVFVLATLLRIILALVNTEANDDHFGVIDIIRAEQRLPGRDECWECFQPKMYHAFVAGTLELLPVEARAVQIRVAQLINCLAGCVTLVVIYRFLNLMPLPDTARILSFSVIGLNPRFIAINAQATNDSFVILFSTVAIAAAYLFFSRPAVSSFVSMTGFSILAALSKASGWVLLFGIALVFTLKALAAPKDSARAGTNYLWQMGAFVAVFVVAVLPMGQYLESYCRYGSLFVTNSDKKPLPGLVDDTFYGRPGVTSIRNSYLTFRLVDMIRHPVVTNDAEHFPWHRTSFWSQMYGRAHFVRFDDWPISWQTESTFVLNVGRALLLLGLVPTLLFVWGITRRLWEWSHAVPKSRLWADTNEWILAVFLFGYLSLSIMYSLQYRDYATMKVIFVFPALLPIAYFLAEGCANFYCRFGSDQRIWLPFLAVFSLLLLLYCVDVVSLIIEMPKYGIPPTVNSWQVAPLPSHSTRLGLICAPWQ